MAKAGLTNRITRQLLTVRGAAVVSALAVVAVIIACVSVLLDSRIQLVRRADIMARNILLLADQTVDIEFGRYDTRILDVVDDLAAKGDGQMPSDNALFGGEALRRSIGDIVVVGPHGSVLASSRPDLTAGFAGLLPLILAHPGDGAGGLAMSTLISPGRAPPLIVLTHLCAPGACGSAAAVIAMLPMSWIQGVLDGLELGRDGVIGLLDSQGVLLARQPPTPWKIGQAVEHPAVIARIERSRHSFVYLKRSNTDGVRRRMTGARIGGLPLVAIVGISTNDVLSGWTSLVRVTLLAVLVLSGGLVGLTVLLARQVNRKLQVDRKLIHANAQLAELARTDALTGLLNRRGFDESLEREWRRCRRGAKPISLLMLDADHFKAYNDRFGHQAGDVVLRAAAACILGRIRRPGDIGARYGGEEFAVVLPDTDLAGGRRIAEAIRAGVEGMALPHSPGARVTVSIGLSCAAPAEVSAGDGSPGAAGDLVAAADAALYESKAGGRNRVTARVATPRPAVQQAPA